MHFQEYSHPTKEDSEAESEEDRPECPYGSSCYRRNPQHTRDFKHTAGNQCGPFKVFLEAKLVIFGYI